jgi:hypothetical protein
MSEDRVDGPGERDMQGIVDYVDGGMSPEEQSAFEERMEANPELRRAAEEFLDQDLLLHAHPEDVRRVAAPSWIARHRALVAAAAAVVAVFGLWAIGSDEEAGDRISVVAAAPNAADMLRHDALVNLSPPWSASVRGESASGKSPNVEAEDFVKKVDDMYAARPRSSEGDVLGTGFRLLLELDGPRTVVVLGVSQQKSPRRLFPDRFDTRALGRTRYEAGERWVPGFPVNVDAAGEVDFVKPLIVRESDEVLTVLIGLRPEPLTASELARIDARITSAEGHPSPVGELSAALIELGFEVEQRTVRDPNPLH